MPDFRFEIADYRLPPPAGAKVTVDDPQAVTAKVRLAFSRDARTGRNCEVVWRRGKTLGVKFVR